MRVLVACEFSGAVRDAFLERGHEAYSCDLLPGEGLYPEFHFQSSIEGILRQPKIWDLMIAHPPCTRLCNSGVRWLNERNLWRELDEAAAFFRMLLNTGIHQVAVENPIPHKYAIERIGRKYDQLIQPWQFGHGETKATCLWLKNLPPLKPTNIVEGREARIHKASPGPDRWKERSITFQGIAEAMADQWGGLARQAA